MNNSSSSDNFQNGSLSRHERREQRRAMRGSYVNGTRAGGLSWVAGLLLIALGVGFLLQNQGMFTFPFENWWSLFILIPILGSLDRAWQSFRNSGNRLDRSVGGALLGAGILILVMLTLLFELNWVVVGPLLIILVGVGILLNAMLPAGNTNP